MKRVLTAMAAAAMLFAHTAHAGGMAEPAMPEVVIVEDTTANSGHIIVPILAVIFIAATLAD
jgi:hypothetical protein